MQALALFPVVTAAHVSLQAQGTRVGPAPRTMAASNALRLEDIYRDYYEFVWRSVRRLGVADGAVDDAVQDVFIVVHRRLGDFEGRSSLKTWLFGISMRVVKDHRRRSSRRDRRHRDAARETSEAAATPDQEMARRQAIELVDDLLDKLDGDQRAVFVMAEIENLTAPEIADALGVKINTVYSRLRLGRKKFERALSRMRVKEQRSAPWTS